MSEQAVLSIAVVCEADADRRIACDLADRVVSEHAVWITSEVVENYRRFRGLDKATPFLPWSKVHDLAKKQGIRAHGWFSGKPGEPDAFAGRRALLVLIGSARPLDAVLLIRDSDGQEQRRLGQEQARSDQSWAPCVVIGVAHPKRECWVLNGFEPQDAMEEHKVSELRRELGFGPCEKADRLNAQKDGAKRDAKRVLQKLTDGSAEREAKCWRETSLGTLETRGEHTGLRAYLSELRERLVPLFRDHRASPDAV
jgi:hypothetical protein